MNQFVKYLLFFVLLTSSTNSVLGVDDEALLEDLGADLLEPVPADEARPFDEWLLEQLGEDVGLENSRKDKRLSEVVMHMQEARAVLESLEHLRGATTAQENALKGLDAMIAELAEKKSRCSGGQCDKPPPPKTGKKKNNSSKAGKSAATSASATKTQAEDASAALIAVGDLVKDLWGHLPQRQREQILQPLSAEFLPQYATEIEAYFRDLAEP